MTTSDAAGTDRPGSPRTRRGQGPGGRRTTGAPGWRPPAGPALLDRLRVTGRARPVPDPELVADLRSHLGLDVGTGHPVPGGPVVVTAARLTQALVCAAHAEPDGPREPEPTPALACGALIDVLFRQLVVTGSLDDPFADGLDALSVDDRRRPLLAWIDALAPGERDGLRAEVLRQAEGLRQRWPALDPSWLPRTKECLRVPATAGGFELVARVDLAVGRPAVDEASVALVDVTSGTPRAAHAADRRFHALVETLRSGVPPFAVATYYTRTGECDVDAVTADVVVHAARRCRAGLDVLVGAGPGRWSADGSSSWCGACADGPLQAPPTVHAAPPIAMAGVRTAAGATAPPPVGALPMCGERAA